MTQADSDPLAEALALFREGRGVEAHEVLAPAMAAGLDRPEAHQLLGLILHGLGDLDGCERALRTVVRRRPGEQLAVQTLARMLTDQGRDDEAVALYQDLVRSGPDNPGAEFGLAAILYGAGREAEAEAACRRALAKGLDRIDAWLFLGRLLNLQSRFDEAEAAYRTAVERDPLSPDAQRELAQLIWMRTADVDKARALLDAAPPTAALTAITVKLLQDAGEEGAAYVLAAERAARDPGLQVLAGRAALRTDDPSLADRHLAAAPPWVNALARAKGQIEADLALGRPLAAAQRAEALNAAYPDDHYVTALLTAAWRLTGDPRHGERCDYGRLVRTYRIDAPGGWSSLEAYLADLERALDRLHGPLTHPVGQSLRHGSQTQRSLMDYPDPEVQAFFRAIDGPIRRHVAALGETCGYAVSGAWSVRLNRQGFHTNHVHPEGWLSSAFYVRTPKGRGHEGWLKFGEPGVRTSPALGPEHLVEPEPGMLVLFPSYMWHGTVPLSADRTRLTCAFDLVRA